MKFKEEDVIKRVRKSPKVGPSDSSDTIADRPGELDADSDAAYTGERSTVGIDPHADLNVEYDADRIVDAEEAGLGAGLDEAEEAQLGVTDEELEEEERAARAAPVKKPKP
jgi:hypothetical protein